MSISQKIWAEPVKQIPLRKDFGACVTQKIQNTPPNPPKKLWSTG